MKRKLAVHKDLIDCKITEMEDTETNRRYFTAVICGWKNFKFFSNNNEKSNPLYLKVLKKVKEIRDNIKADENYIETIGSIFFLK